MGSAMLREGVFTWAVLSFCPLLGGGAVMANTGGGAELAGKDIVWSRFFCLRISTHMLETGRTGWELDHFAFFSFFRDSLRNSDCEASCSLVLWVSFIPLRCTVGGQLNNLPARIHVFVSKGEGSVKNNSRFASGASVD